MFAKTALKLLANYAKIGKEFHRTGIKIKKTKLVPIYSPFIPIISGRRKGWDSIPPPKLIVGLGNPGEEYKNNRHNIGFVIVNELCKKIHTPDFKKKRKYFITKKNDNLFLLPRTYMNLSGIAIRKAVKKYKIALNNLLIVLDDINLPLGKIRIRENGSSGGHNGLKSIIAELNSQEFPRVRMGVGVKNQQESFSSDTPLRDFVLSDFTEEEINLLEKPISQSVELITHFLFQDYKKMSDMFSQMNSLSH